MRNIITIMKKELMRVFKDPKLVFSVFILPGLVIFVLYSILGNALTNMYTSDEYTIYLNNAPTEVFDNLNELALLGDVTVNYYENKDGLTQEEIILLLKDESLDLAIYFYEDEMSYYHKSVNISSNSALNFFLSSLANEQKQIVVINDHEYLINLDALNGDVSEIEDIEQEISSQMTSILPMLIMTFLFTGALSFGPESIAGDKERGTIATLLATPTKRSEIALGKIISLSILSVLAGLSSFIGVMLSLPQLMGGASGVNTSLNYGVSDYIGILILLASAVLVIISIVSIISAYARTVKEATSYSSPFMILTMIIGLSNMFMTGEKALVSFFIPLFNVVQMLDLILSSNFDLTFFLITISTNLILTVGLAYVLTKQFKSEKIMFAK